MGQRIISSKLYERRNAVFELMPPFPNKQMSIELTNICNHKCVFCPHSKMTRTKRHIDDDLFFRVIQEAYDLGMREVGLFINGEPFMNPKLPEYIKRVKEIGFTYVYITTNGALATPERSAAIMDAGLDSIKFSINAGSRDTYLEIHGVDDFDTVIQNAIWHYKYRNDTHKRFNLLCSYVVTTKTMHEAKAFKDKYSYLFDDISFLKVFNRGGMIPEATSMIPDIEGKNKTEKCAHPFNCVYVTCESFLSPCALDVHLDLKLADLNCTSLRDAWYGEAMKQFRQRFIDGFDSLHPQCRACYENESILANILDI